MAAVEISFKVQLSGNRESNSMFSQKVTGAVIEATLFRCVPSSPSCPCGGMALGFVSLVLLTLGTTLL